MAIYFWLNFIHSTNNISNNNKELMRVLVLLAIFIIIDTLIQILTLKTKINVLLISQILFNGLLIIVEMIVIFLIIRKRMLYELLQEHSIELLRNYNNSLELQVNIDDIQRSMKCCGVTSPNDWNNIGKLYISKSNITNVVVKTLPISCCDSFAKYSERNGCYLSEKLFKNESQLPIIEYSRNIHSNGCLNVVYEWFSIKKPILYGILGILLTIQSINLLLHWRMYTKSSPFNSI